MSRHSTYNAVALLGVILASTGVVVMIYAAWTHSHYLLTLAEPEAVFAGLLIRGVVYIAVGGTTVLAAMLLDRQDTHRRGGGRDGKR